MKFAIVLACLFATAIAAPVNDADAVVLRYDNDNIGIGEYHYGLVWIISKIKQTFNYVY